MIMLEPDTLQKSYATKLIHQMKQRPMLEVASSYLVILLTVCYI